MFFVLRWFASSDDFVNDGVFVIYGHRSHIHCAGTVNGHGIVYFVFFRFGKNIVRLISVMQYVFNNSGLLLF